MNKQAKILILRNTVKDCYVRIHSSSPQTMLSTISRRIARPQAMRSLRQQRRNAGGAPHYNEPSGWLFGEKVRRHGVARSMSCIDSTLVLLFSTSPVASANGPETAKRGMGADMVLGNVWRHGLGCGVVVL